MTRLKSPTARWVLVHAVQSAALVAVGVLAMAAAPAGPQAFDLVADAGAAPTAPPVTAVAKPPAPPTRQIVFSDPVRGFPVNSRFGTRKLAGEAKPRAHKGIDIAAPKGTAVLSTAEGRVVRTGHEPGGYGSFIEIRHPNGMTSFYAHLSRIDVYSGMEVDAGARIGLVGSTGYSTGPHLHFEIRRRGVQVNPARVLGEAFQVAIR
ncbi:M23 family metallopeptidase [Brevundimonas vitis]|nr:M23 family metallopeptidase [Brevundimonas vitisensis]